MKNATILIVDDESALLIVFQRWFEREGYRVFTADDGLEALAIARRETIDLVVSDIRMPRMDGIELAGRLKRECAYVPKMMFVSGYPEITKRDMFDLGVEAILGKPIERGDLIAAARACLTDREERWRTPLATVPEKTFQGAYDSIVHAATTGHFAFGRGGFCAIAEPYRFREERIAFDVAFRDDGHALRGQGSVRWSDPSDRLIGVEIQHVVDAERAWVVGVATQADIGTFIPKAVRR